MNLQDFERPSASDRAWRPISWIGGFYGNAFAVPVLMVLAFLFGEPPRTEFTSVRLNESVVDGSSDIRTFPSGFNLGIYIAYNNGNANRLEVVLTDRSGKAISGLANTCSKNILGNQGGDYQCAFQAVPPGKYEIQLWLSGAIKGKYLLEFNPPAPVVAPLSVGDPATRGVGFETHTIPP